MITGSPKAGHTTGTAKAEAAREEAAGQDITLLNHLGSQGTDGCDGGSGGGGGGGDGGGGGGDGGITFSIFSIPSGWSPHSDQSSISAPRFL